MNFKSLFLIGFLILFCNNILAQNDSLKVNKKRVAIVSSSLCAALGGSYYYIQNSWWADKQTSFHFDDGADLTYALNVDKVGHFMGGLEAADIFSSSMKWAGMNEKQALWYGGFFGSGLQLAIEMKDAGRPDISFGRLLNYSKATLSSLYKYITDPSKVGNAGYIDVVIEAEKFVESYRGITNSF